MININIFQIVTNEFDKINEKNIIVSSALLSEVFKYYNKIKTCKHIKYPFLVKMCYRSVHIWGLYMY